MSSSDPAKLHNIPAAKPPPGVIVNRAHPATDGPIATIVGSIMLTLMVSFVGVRIYTKAKSAKKV